MTSRLGAIILGLALVAGCSTPAVEEQAVEESYASNVPTPQPPSAPAPPDASEADPISDRTRRAAEAYVAFAGGSDASVPWGEEVRYFPNRTAVGPIDRREAGDRQRWEACLADTSVAEEGKCVVSVLDVLRRASRSGKPLPLQPTPPKFVGCDPVEVPKIDAVVEQVVIRQRPEEQNCFADFAVTLLLNQRGKIIGVDFVLSGP